MSDWNPWDSNSGNDNASAFPVSDSSMLKSADLHNLGNVGSSWYDVNPLNLPKFAAVSVVSGLNSIYNTGVKIGNFFGADVKESQTSDVVNNVFGGLDSDLGAYYESNKPAADLAGFLVTSLLPGIGGIKILNAGQKALAAANEGMVGTNLGMALGLRTPQIERYIGMAGKEIAAGQAGFTSITTSATKALSLGVYQNVLEGAAFETAVQATMQASPILDNQSYSDIAWNIGTAGLFGGVLGGAFQSAKTIGAIKRSALEESLSINPFGQRNTSTFLNTKLASDKIISLADDLEHGPVLNPGDPNYLAQVQKMTERKVRINNDLRSAIMELTPGSDNDLGRMVADISTKESADTLMQRFMDTHEMGRIGTKLKMEDAIKKYIDDGLGVPEDLQVQYAKLTGEDAGKIVDEIPRVVNLADRVVGTGGTSVRASILSDVRSQGFKIADSWDAAEAPLDTSGHLNAERRQIWAHEILKEVPDGATIGFRDIPVLERALQDGQLDIKLLGTTGKVLKDKFGSVKELQDYIISAKEDAASRLQVKAMKTRNLTNEEQTDVTTKIGKIVNTTVGRLEGTAVTDQKDYFAWQQLQKQRDDLLAQKGITHPKDIETDPRFLPTWVKISKQIRDKQDVNGNVIDGLTYIRTQQRLAQQAIDNVAAKQAPEMATQLPSIKDTWLARTNNLGTGAGRFTINNPGYDSLGSAVSFIGSKLSDFARAAKDAFSDSASGRLYQLARNQDAVIEWASINQKITRSAQQWVKTFDEDGEHVLVDAQAYKSLDRENGDTIGDLEDNQVIRFAHKETAELAEAHAQQELKIYSRRNERASAMGADQSRNLTVGDAPLFRPLRPDPKQYPFFAFVKDPTITGQGHTSMIFAQTDKELEAKAAAVTRARPEMQVWYKRDTEEFQRAEHEYNYDRTLSDNYIDTTLKNTGVYSDYFAKTDPQRVADEYLQHHLKLIDTDSREIIRSKYSAQFDWLEDQAHAFSRGTTSKFGGSFARLESEASNPYLSYIKTALNLSRVQEAPLWYNINRFADQAVSGLVGKIQDIWGTTKEVSPEQLESINSSLQKYGMNTGYYDAATNLLVNHQAPKAVLTKFVRGANAVLAKLTLGLDPLNALTNALGANILRSTELRQLVDAISAGDADIAGSLAGLSKVDITGQGDLVLSPVKLMARAMKDFTSDSPEALANAKLFEQLGFQKGISGQFRQIIGDDLALRGTESVSVLQSKLRDAISRANDLSEAGQKYSGNKLAEEFNRFVSARSIQLLTEPAVAKGLITREEQYAYMNTFVNRVEGNLVAAQRPFAFQGPIGQAVGLFQSYQFNIMQQMFRYISEGSTKDAAMLLGLQGTFFGIQGMPAFQAINQHIIGTASGNPKHIDAYDALYGIAGKNLGDLLTYGLPSKLLSTNLYARGDINPRQLTILPTALSEVPIVGAYTKFFGSVKDTVTKIAGGANVWETFLQGVEHNGISRPLSGIAQTLQSTTGNGTPFSTTSKGSIIFSNDLFSLASLTRLAGGRPLDEAIVNDGVFRIHAYQQYDMARMETLAEEIKASSINGQNMSQDQYATFAHQYAANGGKQLNFNKYMMREIRAANTSGIDAITRQLNSPFAQKAQELMGDGSANINPFIH